MKKGEVSLLENMKKIHFVGIGGAGMSAIAKILVEKNFEVSGSDLHGSELVEKLRSQGAKLSSSSVMGATFTLMMTLSSPWACHALTPSSALQRIMRSTSVVLPCSSHTSRNVSGLIWPSVSSVMRSKASNCTPRC